MKPAALYYLALLDDVRACARGLGYAIGLHGSLTNDFDLIAVPWVPEAKSAEELADAIATLVKGHREQRHADKPHGRKAWLIRLVDYDTQTACGVPMGTARIDLSVMPLVEPVPSSEFPIGG